MNPNPNSPVDKDLPPAADTDSATHQQRLVDALQGYLSEFEQGKLPDRSELLAEHPEIAGELSACLASLDFIHHASPALTAQGTDGGPEPSLAKLPFVSLGDFRIIREIGRGGMGVVYEAEQLTLSRRVALKILPFAAMLDSHQLQRFRNEARAAATLSHPHIVPVHYVGFERGVNYFAMQLIEGCSLAQVIQELRRSADAASKTSTESPATASAANDFIVASAKAPAEIGTSLDEDAGAADRLDVQGSPLEPASDESRRIVQAFISTRSTARNADYHQQVARIGLQAAEALEYAHSYGIVHRDIKPANLLLDVGRNVWLTDFGLARLESEATATMTGDVLGTLRYMSPEQARGDRDLVDPRSDIYGLGATLYELLTLSPLVGGTDRQDILTRIANVEPKPLRPLDNTIPVDLETIVLTAVSKDPDERYDTAGAMAEDLKRFLTHQTIQARRPSFAQQLVRWSRRNRRTLTLATILLLVALTVSTLICAGAYSVAKRQREEAEAERAQAQENLQLAIEAVDQMYTGVATQWLASDTVLSVLQAHYLEQASSIYRRIIRNTPDADANKQLLAILWERIGTIHMALDEMSQARQMSEARQALVGAIKFNNQLLGTSPDDASIRERLAKCHNNLARTLRDLGNNDETLRAIDTAQQHMQQLADRFPDKPDYQHGLAVNDLLRAEFLLSIGQPDKAEQWARQAETRLKDLRKQKWEELTVSLSQLKTGLCLTQSLRQQSRPEDSRKVCDETLRLCGFMRIDYWDHPYVQQAEALLVREAAELDLMAGQVESAVGHFRRSLQLQNKSLRGRVKPSHWLTAYVWGEYDRDKLEEVPRARDEGYEEPDKFCTYIETQIRMAPALMRIGRPHEAEQILAEAEEMSQYLTDCYAKARYRVGCANSWAELARLLDDVRPKEASMARERATWVWWSALREAPVSRQYRSGVRGAVSDFDWFVESFPECVTEGLPNWSETKKRPDRPPVYYFHNWGIQEVEAEMWGSAIKRLSRAQEQRTEGHAFDWLYLAWAHFKKGDTPAAREWFDKADQWIKQQTERNVELDELRTQVAQLMSV